MTRIRSFARIATVALAIAVIAAPGFAAVGSANFKTVVASLLHKSTPLIPPQTSL